MSLLKRSSKIICGCLILIAASQVMAQGTQADKQASYPIDSIIGLRWIDRGQNTMSLTFYSEYPNGCYILDGSAGYTATNERKVYITQSVLIRDGLCTMAIVPQTESTFVFLPESGHYEVIDSTSNKVLGWIVVKDGELAFYKK